MGETPFAFSFLQPLKNRYVAGFLHSESRKALYGFDEVVSQSNCDSGWIVLCGALVSGLGCRVVTCAIDRSKGCVQH
jgi:hypothetical protein